MGEKNSCKVVFAHFKLMFYFLPLLFVHFDGNFFHFILHQLLPKHCAESISAARHRKQKKAVPKKGEVQKEKPGAESQRKDRTVTTKLAFLFLFRTFM